MDQTVKQFIEAARHAGATDETVARLLKEAGWSEHQVSTALLALYEEKTGMKAPAPRAARGESAKDAFLYILSFGTLGTWVGALGSFVFTLLDKYFPDVVVGQYLYSQSYNVSTQLASIIVAFPIYLFTMRLITRDVVRNPEKYDSPVRKWLTYIALLLAAGAVIGDLVTFLAYFLRGELTVRFVLKVLAVLALAGGVFWYYLLTLRPRGGKQA